MTREFRDTDSTQWLALAVEEVVAHGRQGARLAFRLAGDESAPVIPGGITFNSREAAEFALRTLGEKELRRRLALARAETGAIR